MDKEGRATDDPASILLPTGCQDCKGPLFQLVKEHDYKLIIVFQNTQKFPLCKYHRPVWLYFRAIDLATT